MNKSMLSALAVVTLLVTAALAMPARAAEAELEIFSEGMFGMESLGTADDTADFYMTIQNIGDADYTDVSASADFTENGWDDGAVDFTDHLGQNGQGNIALGSLEYGYQYRVWVNASVPSDASPGDMATLKVTVTADGDSETVVFTVRVTNWFAMSADDTSQSFDLNAGGVTTHSYDIYVLNVAVDENGDGRQIEDDITLSYAGITPGWTVSFDQNDEFMDSIVLYGPHAADDPDDISTWDMVTVYVTLNDDVPAGENTIDLQGSSSNDGDDYYMQPPGYLSLYANVAPYYRAVVSGEGQKETTVEGGTLSWEFTVKNDGNSLDGFALEWDVTGLANTDWSTDAIDGNTGFLNMNAEYTDTVTLTVPAGAASTDTGYFILTVTSTEDNTWSQMFVFGASVEQSYGLTLTTPANMTALPGNSADFPFTVTNTGNGDDTYTITVETLATTYNPTPSITTAVLAAGAPAQFTLDTTVPANSPFPSSSGDITVTVTSSDGTTAASATVSVATAQVFELAWSYSTNDNGTDIKSGEATAGGANGTVSLILTNTGNGADTVAFVLVNAPNWAELDDSTDKVLVSGGEITVWVNLDPAADTTLGDEKFQIRATSADNSTKTSGDLTATVVAKETGGDGGGDIVVPDEDEGWLPGFGLLAALSALGAALLLRRRS